MRYGDSFSSVSSSLSVSSWDTTTTVCMFGQPKYSRVGSSQAGQHQHHDQARIRFRFRNDRWMFGQPGTGETGELQWCVLTNLATQLTSKQPDTRGGEQQIDPHRVLLPSHTTTNILQGVRLFVCLITETSNVQVSSKYWNLISYLMIDRSYGWMGLLSICYECDMGV